MNSLADTSLHGHELAACAERWIALASARRRTRVARAAR